MTNAAKTSDTKYTAADMVKCVSPDGWSFHAPASTDEQIADGSAPYITCGDGTATKADRQAAFLKWNARTA